MGKWLSRCRVGLVAGALLPAWPGLAAADPLVQPVVEVARHREPVLVHPAHMAEAQRKLDAFARRTGRRPNVLVFIMDDVGWGTSVCMAAAWRSARPLRTWTGSRAMG